MIGALSKREEGLLKED